RPGGDRIYGVFDNQLTAALKKLPFDQHLSINNVKKVVSEADGYPLDCSRARLTYGHAIVDCLMVHFVLKELVRKSLNETGRNYFVRDRLEVTPSIVIGSN
ncbi:hypothetical protein IFM89_000324, partial [Coptis chinensis]